MRKKENKRFSTAKVFPMAKENAGPIDLKNMIVS